MKIRWTANSLRLRITPTELTALESGESVRVTLELPGADWSVALQPIDHAETDIAADGGAVTLRLGTVDLADLSAPKNEGVYFSRDGFRYLIEKDFPCLHPSATELLEPVTETFAAPPDFEERKSPLPPGTRSSEGGEGVSTGEAVECPMQASLAPTRRRQDFPPRTDASPALSLSAPRVTEGSLSQARSDCDKGALPRPTLRLRDGRWHGIEDTLAVEEPLEIVVNDRRFTVTLRTPGADFDLVRGLLLAEGLIACAGDIGSLRYCDAVDPADENADPNRILVQTRTAPPADRQWQRSLISATSCGLCGAAAIEAIQQVVQPLPPTRRTVAPDLLLRLPNLLREQQKLFGCTGGLHAAALFDATGACLAAFEDIGRHNATDKAIGRGLAEGWLPHPTDPDTPPLILLISGRASFEITQKALMARIPIVCAVSAASTLAVDLAAANHQTLVGFLRETGMTVYSAKERISDREIT